MRKTLISFTLLILSISAFAQYVDKDQFAQRVFPNIKTNIENGNYTAAFEDLSTLDSLFPNNPVFTYYLGLCYLNFTGTKAKAVVNFAKAAAFVNNSYKEGDYKDKKTPPIAIYYLARAYHLEYKLDSAIANYKRYKNYIESNDAEALKDLDHQIEMCNNAKVVFANPITITIDNLGEVVNSKYDEYAPVLDALENTLIFTSRREGTTGGGLADDGKYFEDIYISTKTDGKWSKPLPIGDNINTVGHEATISLSADGEQLYIYKDDMGDGNIYVSKFNGDTWGRPVRLGSNINTGARETHASISADNSALYFTSDREGSVGGMDIYVCKRLPNGEWGVAENLGPNVNSKYDEEGPFIHPDGNTLFFSSRGHNSIGGFDIFFSNKTAEGSWTPPQNIGFPINTADDEYFFVTSPDGKRAYYASGKPGGFGEKDLYLINMEMEKEIPLTIYKGQIVSHDNITPSDVEITAMQDGELYGIYRPNANTGRFIIILHSGRKYTISYEAKGYMFHSEIIDVPEETAFFIIKKEVELQPIKPKGK